MDPVVDSDGDHTRTTATEAPTSVPVPASVPAAPSQLSSGTSTRLETPSTVSIYVGLMRLLSLIVLRSFRTSFQIIPITQFLLCQALATYS